jgi:membrane fusion protein, multidrug efflux system
MPEPDSQSAKVPTASVQQNAPVPARPTFNLASNWIIPVLIFAAAGLVFFLISGFWTSWESATNVKTDDAYIRADIAPLSTKVTGVVNKITVNDFDKVQTGQLLVELKNDEYKARVEQARQAITEAEVKLADMKENKARQDAKVVEARIAIDNARQNVKQADDSTASTQAAIDAANAGIEAAKAAIVQAQASTKAATADVTKTSLERTRQEALLAEESATKSHIESTVDDNERALANLDAQKAAETRSFAELGAKQAQLRQAMQQFSSSKSEKEKSLLAIRTKESELSSEVNQRKLLDGEEKQLAADVASKKAGLISAQVDLDYTKICAPSDGVVGELKVKPGQLVSAGTQVVTFVSSVPWVIANYRETQLRKVKDGDKAEVTIDALPGVRLNGHVERIAPASGAQFSLLPPDNASGNFTKITQRIPVKIAFDEESKLEALRPGMSVAVVIKPGHE